jgi:succinate dehydrogenase / fumarate reductase membrane anchor subunit
MSKIESSTKHGAKHWLMQRLSALALIPLIIWLAFSFVRIAQDPQGYLPVFFAYPLNAIAGILLITTALYHGALGMRVVLEDYVSCKCSRTFLIILINFVSILTALAAVLAIVRLHLIG